MIGALAVPGQGDPAGETPTPDIPPTETPTLTATPTNTPSLPTPSQLVLWLAASPSWVNPGATLQLAWRVEGWDGVSALELSFLAPAGFAPLDLTEGTFDPGAQTLRLALRAAEGAIVWTIAEEALGPFRFQAELLQGETLVARADLPLQGDVAFLVDPQQGGTFTALDGQLSLTFPAVPPGAAPQESGEPLRVRVLRPVPQALPAYSLSGRPFQIVAEGADSGQAVTDFPQPITLEVAYDEALLRGDPAENGGANGENTLTLFYCDESMSTWRPLPSQADSVTNRLTAWTGSSGVFDTATQDWQAARTPSVSAFQVSSFTGAATYSLPLALPPGPGGLTPSLTLSYNSQVVDAASSRTQAGWAGMGWSLETGSIVRDMHGTMQYDGDDTFSLSAAGVSSLLLPIPDADVDPATTDYRTADESFWRIRHYAARQDITDASYWVVWDKSGTQYFFEDRAHYPEYGSCWDDVRTWKWSLTRVRNAFGQELIYRYTHETQNKQRGGCENVHQGLATTLAVYPSEIVYPHGRYRVRFVGVSDRQDYDPAWADEYALVFYGRSRLAEVVVEQDGDGDGTFEQVVRRYALRYESDASRRVFPNVVWPGGGRTLTLVEVQEYGLGGTTSLPAMRFEYGDPAKNGGLGMTAAENGYGGRVEFRYATWNDVETTSADKIIHVYGGDDGVCTFYGYNGGWRGADEASSAGCIRYWNASENKWVAGRVRLTGSVENSDGPATFRPGGLYRLAVVINPFDQGAYARVGLSDGVNAVYGPLTPLNGRTTLQSEFRLPSSASAARPLIQCTDASGSSYRSCEMDVYELWLLPGYSRVTQRRLTDSVGGQSVAFAYAYEGAASNDPAHSLASTTANPYQEAYSEFRGHASVQETGPDGSVTTTWFYQDDERRGQAYRTQIRSADGSLLQEGETVLAASAQPLDAAALPRDERSQVFTDLASTWVRPVERIERVYEGQPNWVGTRAEYQYDEALQDGAQFGNLTGVVESSWDGSAWQVYRSAPTGYHPTVSDSVYLVGLPAYNERYDAGGALLAQTLYLYDDQTDHRSPPTSGILTGQRAWVEADRYADEVYAYDARGNRTGVTRFTGYGSGATLASSGAQTTSIAYDPIYHTYPTSTTNSLGHTTAWTYDFAHGLPTSEVDPNGASTTAAYDPFGRLIELRRPGDESGAPTISAQYVDTAPYSLTLTQRLDGLSSTVHRRFYDGLGRLIQSQMAGAVIVPQGSSDILVDSFYDGYGRLVHQSVPYAVAQGSGYHSPDLSQPFTATTYDALGRPVLVTSPDGSTLITNYQSRTTSTTDPMGRTTVRRFDAWGRLVEVVSPLPPTVSYFYDPLDRLIQVETGGARTTIDYDAAGRKLGMQDPDMGVWSYAYDALGNLLSQTDARGCVTTLNYDLLNRLTGKSYAGPGACATTPAVSTIYDQGAYGVGRRTGMSDVSGSTAWAYDARGRLVQETRAIAGAGTFVNAWSYNSADQVVAMTYPGGNAGELGEVVSYGYHPQGWADSLTSDLGIYVQQTAYDAAGRVLRREFRMDLLSAVYDYFAWTVPAGNGRLQAIRSMGPQGPRRHRWEPDPSPSPLQALYYYYDAVGNVTSIKDWAAGVAYGDWPFPQFHQYGYDELDRLVSASVARGNGGTYSESYTYDPETGVLISKGGATYTTDPAHPHAVSEVNGTPGLWYDESGNLVRRLVGGHAEELIYDAESRLIRVMRDGSILADFVYDGDGNRVLGSVDGVTTVYVGDHYEIEGSTVRSYYDLGGQRIALRENGALYWLLTDHLGSTAVTVDEGGKMASELRYKAFGETRYAWGATPTTYRYTGQREESSLGLYFYRSRWYRGAQRSIQLCWTTRRWGASSSRTRSCPSRGIRWRGIAMRTRRTTRSPTPTRTGIARRRRANGGRPFASPCSSSRGPLPPASIHSTEMAGRSAATATRQPRADTSGSASMRLAANPT